MVSNSIFALRGNASGDSTTVKGRIQRIFNIIIPANKTHFYALVWKLWGEAHDNSHEGKAEIPIKRKIAKYIQSNDPNDREIEPYILSEIVTATAKAIE